MQLSNRLTFSLASLVLIFALAFAATPALAETGGPAVTVTEYSGVETPADAPSNQQSHTQERSDFRVRLAFNSPVSTTPTTSDIQYALGNAKTGQFDAPQNVGNNGDVSVIWTSATTSSDTEFVVTLPSITNTTKTEVVIIVKPDVVRSKSNVKGNVGTTTDAFTLPPIHDATVMFGTPTKVTGAESTHEVTVTFDSGQTTSALNLEPDFALAHVLIEPATGGTVTIGTEDAAVTGKLSYPLTVVLAGANKTTVGVTLSVDPGYAAAAATNGSVKVVDDNTAPVYVNTSVLSLTGTVGTAITDLNAGGATDAENDTITYSWDADETALGLALNTSTGMITGTPLKPHTQKHTVTATALGGTATRDVNIDIKPLLPSVSSITVSDVNATARTFRIKVVFTGANPALTTFTDTSLAATDKTQATVNLSVLNESERFTASTQTYEAILQYGDLAELPLTITTKDDVASDDPKKTATVKVMTTGPVAGTTIAAKAYAVFVPSNHDAAALPAGLTTHTVDMPDLGLGAFFVSGGTIDVSVTGGAKHNVIITEIMVAKDLGRAGQTGAMRPEAGQWIELYNNTTTAINVSDITIAFTKGDPAPTMLAGVTDRLSNTVGAGWGFEAAFKDALSGQTATSASNVVTVTKTFKSLRRSYKKNANDYDDTKKLQDDGTFIGDGWDQRSWKLTVDSRLFLAGRVGTPGSENRPTVFTPETFTAPSMSVRFNEIANRSDNTNEWIELAGAKDTNLKKHKISIVTGYNKVNNTGTENTIYEFPDADVKIPGDGILLLTDQNPTSNELAADIEKGVAKPKRYRVVTLADLPNNGNFLLVLRDGGGKILDVAGHLTGLDDDKPYTQLWPLKGKVGNISDKNKLVSGKVYRRARAIQGYSSNKGDGNEPAFEVVGFTGIGYDRIAPETDENGGTPGYPNNIAKNYEQQGTGTVATPVIISEIMYATGDRANMPQWIELYNTSKTEAINLSGWRVTILNHDKDNGDGMGDITYAGDLSKNYDLSGNIPPNQTFLLVAYQGRNDTKLLSKRIQLLRANRGELLLSQYGFEITLYPKAKDNKDANRKVTDQAGNLGTVEDALVRRNPRSYIDPAWELPAGTNEEGARVSIVRGWAKGTKVGLVTHRSSDINNVLPGTMKPAWSTFDMSGQLVRTLDKTYYGHSTDIGSPGHTVGGALPVSLSKFRPERLDDGSIVVRWITESELNNAGFNILRSDTRDGQFTKLNEQMIKGQGTTSERTVYDFVDKTAKPNVVYYYQIQDVSLDGDVVTLRTSRLKGHISAAGKATTTWGKLKSQD